ncbi:MAG TPA: hypothetical protein VNW90_25340 [Acetobacteraceae bacterium]|jgi:hypothetical protein|nr:hypothetical protein [Acetobacteraceae bacterium]
MNYSELRAAIQTYSLDFEASFVSNIDTFIHLGEARLRLNVRLPNFRKDVTGVLAEGEPLVALPSDFLAPDSLEVVVPDGSLVYLLNKDPEFLDECYPSTSIQGQPRFYAYLNETSIRIGPTPDMDYPTNMGYFYQPASITVTQTSWLGEHFAHALLSGSLVEAAKYMKAEDALYQRFDAAFKEDLQMDQGYAKGRTKKDTYQEPDTRQPI